jgi:hypothetical protein
LLLHGLFQEYQVLIECKGVSPRKISVRTTTTTSIAIQVRENNKGNKIIDTIARSTKPIEASEYCRNHLRPVNIASLRKFYLQNTSQITHQFATASPIRYRSQFCTDGVTVNNIFAAKDSYYSTVQFARVVVDSIHSSLCFYNTKVRETVLVP